MQSMRIPKNCIGEGGKFVAGPFLFEPVRLYQEQVPVLANVCVDIVEKIIMQITPLGEKSVVNIVK